MTSRIPAVRRHYERQATFEAPRIFVRDGTMREPVPEFVFPKLKPLDIEARECIVCFQNDRNTVLPCGHSLLCEPCTKLLLAKAQPCPNCRTYFSNYVVAEKQPTFRDLNKELNDSDEEDSPSQPPRLSVDHEPSPVEVAGAANSAPGLPVVESGRTLPDLEASILITDAATATDQTSIPQRHRRPSENSVSSITLS
eukprot:c12029_g1_i1.p1 GENE.c12029_g1_i1~~c12029_g1_i1.p1  ORF type:complete len:197 (+),score=21.71 c12029_g1_i1:441-1031(+)